MSLSINIIWVIFGSFIAFATRLFLALEIRLSPLQNTIFSGISKNASNSFVLIRHWAKFTKQIPPKHGASRYIQGRCVFTYSLTLFVKSSCWLNRFLILSSMSVLRLVINRRLPLNCLDKNIHRLRYNNKETVVIICRLKREKIYTG